MAERLTHEIQTVAHHEQRVAYQALTVDELPTVARELCMDLDTSINVRWVIPVSVGSDDHRLGCGWLSDLTRPAQWQLELVHTWVTTLLWQGPLPHVISVAGRKLPTRPRRAQR